jgi:hypothetical protein
MYAATQEGSFLVGTPGFYPAASLHAMDLPVAAHKTVLCPGNLPHMLFVIPVSGLDAPIIKFPPERQIHIY